MTTDVCSAGSDRSDWEGAIMKHGGVVIGTTTHTADLVSKDLKI